MHGRVGVVLQAQGKLAEAQAAFGEGLKISRRLAEQDPTNASWQRDLEAAQSRLDNRAQKRPGRRWWSFKRGLWALA